jgi:hypothetical protein
VERFVPSEFGASYEFEQFWPTDTTHRLMARQKAFIRRTIAMAGLDYTIIPAGAWPEYYLLDPVMVMGCTWVRKNGAPPMQRRRPARSRPSWPSGSR